MSLTTDHETPKQDATTRSMTASTNRIKRKTISPPSKKRNMPNQRPPPKAAKKSFKRRKTGGESAISTTARRPPRRVIPEKKDYVLETEPNLSDVVSGRGGRSNHHPGNRPYWLQILQLRDAYRECVDDSSKQQIAQTVVDFVQNTQGGRFLQLESVTERWFLLPPKVIMDKVKQALRDKYVPLWARQGHDFMTDDIGIDAEENVDHTSLLTITADCKPPAPTDQKRCKPLSTPKSTKEFNKEKGNCAKQFSTRKSINGVAAKELPSLQVAAGQPKQEDPPKSMPQQSRALDFGSRRRAVDGAEEVRYDDLQEVIDKNLPTLASNSCYDDPYLFSAANNSLAFDFDNTAAKDQHPRELKSTVGGGDDYDNQNSVVTGSAFEDCGGGQSLDMVENMMDQWEQPQRPQQRSSWHRMFDDELQACLMTRRNNPPPPPNDNSFDQSQEKKHPKHT